MIYTGIGSRDTPKDVLWTMRQIGYGMARRGFTLRSGKADGADRAFEQGFLSFKEAALEGHEHDILARAELYQPWSAFGECPTKWDMPINHIKYSIVAMARNWVKEIHPNPSALSSVALNLHTRNLFQVLGRDLLTPTDFVIYWAKTDKQGLPLGGTRTAVMVAKDKGIPTINMADDDWNPRFKELVKDLIQRKKIDASHSAFTHNRE